MVEIQMDYHLKKLQTEQDRMEGICSEAAVNSAGNRYNLILMASARARELSKGAIPRVTTRRGSVVTALKEMEHGKLEPSYLYKIRDHDRPRRSPKR